MKELNEKGAVVQGPNGFAWIGGAFGNTPTTRATQEVGKVKPTKLTYEQSVRAAKAYAANSKSVGLRDVGPSGPDDTTYHPIKNPRWQEFGTPAAPVAATTKASVKQPASAAAKAAVKGTNARDTPRGNVSMPIRKPRRRKPPRP